jgi:hypothetical protein
VEHPIKALTVLKFLSVNIINYKEWEVEIKEVFSTPMGLIGFPMQTHAKTFSSSGKSMKEIIYYSKKSDDLKRMRRQSLPQSFLFYLTQFLVVIFTLMILYK